MISLTSYLRDVGSIVTVMRNSPDLVPAGLSTAKAPNGIEYIDIVASGNFRFMENAYCGAIEDLLKKRKFDLAIISTGPFYTVKSTSTLKKFGLRYILEFRDLWVFEERRQERLWDELKSIAFRIPHVSKERRAVKNAHGVVVVTPEDKKRMEFFYPTRNVDVIMNGFDEARLNRHSVPVLDLLIVDSSVDYVGIFGKLAYYSSHYASQLLMGIKSLITQGYDIKVLHIGQPEEKVMEILSRIGFPSDRYINLGSLDYALGIEYMRLVDICAVVYSSKGGLGTKVFDYIYLNKPTVLVSSADCALANLVSGFKNGYVCQNSGEVYKACKRVLDLGIDFLDDSGTTRIYSRDYQNKKYYELMTRIMKHG